MLQVARAVPLVCSVSSVRCFRFASVSVSVSGSVCVCGESACSSEITAGCNGNISSFFAFGVDIGYFDVVAGVEGDCAAVLFCGCRVYGPCLNVLEGPAIPTSPALILTFPESLLLALDPALILPVSTFPVRW
jgi:hypothetical protein